MVESKDTQIQAARQVCGRLAFLQKADVQKLLDEPQFLLECQGKLFDPEGKFLVADNAIVGLSDEKGEELKFDAPVPMGAVPETINAVVDAMRKAVRREIEGAMKVEGMALFNSDFINQAIETVDKIANTRATEQAMKDGAEALHKYSASLNSKVDLLSQEAAKEHSPRKQTLINVLLTLNVDHRNFVEHHMCAKAKEFGFPMGPGHEWQHALKFFWDDGMKAKILTYDLEFGYEYMGVQEKLVVTPLTRRCYVELGRGFYQGAGVSLQGPAGTGKTETAKDFYRHLAKLNITTICSDQLQTDDFRQICDGADQSGACLIFDEYNRATREVLDGSKPHFVKQASKKQSGFVCTHNPGYAGRTTLFQGFYETFACIPMGVPELFYIYQVKLHSQGLGCEADRLAKPVVLTIRSCRDECSKQSHYDFGMRNGLQVMSMVGKLFKSGASAEDAVYSGLYHTFYPLFTKEDKAVWQGIVSKNFPNAKLVQMPGDFDAKFAAAFPDASEHTKVKASQIHTKSLFRNHLLVLDTESKMVQDVATTVGATYSEMTFNEELGEAFENQMREQIMKAVENKNHWIIIKGRLDGTYKNVPVGTTYWPEFSEWMLPTFEGVVVFGNGERIQLPAATKFVKVTPNCTAMTPASVSRQGIINMSE